jgi:hypothetical protein
MRTSLVRIALAALMSGCGPEERCDQYRFSGGLYAYCVRSVTVGLPTLSQAEQSCGELSGEAEAECRTAWMDVHIGRTSDRRDDLMQFCRSDDCRMLVLDLQPSSNLIRQLADCQLAGRYARDCMGHAHQRWLLSKPTPDELERVSRQAGPFSAEISEWVGEAIRCGGQADCSRTPQPDLCTRAQLAGNGPTSCGGTAPPPAGEHAPVGTSAPWSMSPPSSSPRN